MRFAAMARLIVNDFWAVGENLLFWKLMIPQHSEDSQMKF
jgi:hypothetical protein